MFARFQGCKQGSKPFGTRASVRDSRLITLRSTSSPTTSNPRIVNHHEEVRIASRQETNTACWNIIAKYLCSSSYREEFAGLLQKDVALVNSGLILPLMSPCYPDPKIPHHARTLRRPYPNVFKKKKNDNPTRIRSMRYVSSS